MVTLLDITLNLLENIELIKVIYDNRTLLFYHLKRFDFISILKLLI